MTNQTPLIWVLADDRMGNVNQALGVAEALNLPFEKKTISYNKKARLPNWIRSASLMGVDIEQSSSLASPWPEILITAGRKTTPIARYIKKKSKGMTKIVQLMWPGFPNSDIDLIATPKHDGIKENNHIINTIGAPNRITPEKLKEEKDKWQKKFSDLPLPKIAVLIGGSTKKGQFTENHAKELVQKLDFYMKDKGGSFLITNSRRTGETATEIIKNNLKTKFYFHDFNSTKENPFFGYLSVSDAIIVTGDSISMCSESCSSGKPVYIYAPEDITPDKHKNFHKNLFKNGYAKPLGQKWENSKYNLLSDSKKIAGILKEKFIVNN